MPVLPTVFFLSSVRKKLSDTTVSILKHFGTCVPHTKLEGCKVKHTNGIYSSSRWLPIIAVFGFCFVSHHAFQEFFT